MKIRLMDYAYLLAILLIIGLPMIFVPVMREPCATALVITIAAALTMVYSDVWDYLIAKESTDVRLLD